MSLTGSALQPVTKLDGLTALRFLAAFWVFVFHFHLRIPLELPWPVLRIISNGALAMPIFFMLSGFVLAHRYRDRYAGFSDFFRARVARIYPAYLVGLALSVPALFVDPRADWASLAYVIPIDMLLLQAWYPNLWSFWHHVGTWSISVEFFLYASFPLVMRIQQLTTAKITSLCLLCLLVAASFVPSLKLAPSSDLPFPVFYATPIYSLPAFIIGVALAALHSRGFRGSLLAPVALGVLLGWAGHLNHRYAHLNLFTLPLIAWTILYAAHQASPHGALRRSIDRAAVYLGDISYGFFVYQIPLILLLEQVVDRAKASVSIAFWVLLAANLLLAAASHRWIEPWGSRLILRLWRVDKASKRGYPPCGEPA